MANENAHSAPKELNFQWKDIHEMFYDETNPIEAIFDAMVARQDDLHGDLQEPCEQAAELLEVFTLDNKPCVQQWRAAVARRQPGLHTVSNDIDEATWNNAHKTGEFCPEWEAALDMPVYVTFGKVFTNKDRKWGNTPDDKWHGKETTWRALIEGDAGTTDLFKNRDSRDAWGFSRHIRSSFKDGSGFVTGNCDTHRRANAVSSICALTLDADSGEFSFKHAVSKLQDAGIAFIAYTSHSHMTTETSVSYDAVVKHAGCNSEPTQEQIKDFARQKKKLAPHVVDSIHVIEMKEQTKDGWMIRLSHVPIPKYRIIVPLAEGNISLLDLANTQGEAQEVVASKVRGLSDMVGIPTDPATLDVSRFFYAARHRPGAEHQIVIHQAPPIRFENVPMVAGTKTRKAGKRPHLPDAITEDGVNVTERYRRYGKRWMLADMCEANGIATTAQVSNGSGKFHVPCPFADGHTDPSDDGATFVMNAEDAKHEFAVVNCQHASCANRRTEDYLAAWIDSGEIDSAILENSEFMSPLPDDQLEEKFLRLTPDETLGEAEARAYLREHLETAEGETRIADGAVENAVELLRGLGVSDTDARQRVDDARADVERQIAERVADKQTDPVSDALRDVENDAPVPHVLAALYDENLVDDDGFILKPDAIPKLYRSYGINTKDEDKAYKLMQLEIRGQMFRNLTERFNWVVLDGEAKLAINQTHGEGIKLWKEQTMGKLYVNRSTKYWDESGKTPAMKEIKPAEVFINARQRGTFFDTCFEPDPVKAEARVRQGAFNLWNGFAVIGREGDWSKLRNHIKDNVCNGDEDIFNFVMTWLASIFARPGTKIPSSLAVIGEQGVGKSKVFDWIRRAIGSAALKVSSGRHLTGNFNAHLDALIFLVCEEAFWGGDKQAAGVMKDLISSDTLQIEGKFQNLVERPNYVNMVFVSNNKWSVPVDGEDARRFLVLECANTQKQAAKYFGAIDDQMEYGGLEAMVHELMNWDPKAVGLTWHSLRNPPVTDGLRQQAGMGLNGPAERLVSILESGVLSGRTQDSEVFYYELADDEPTPIARHHLVAALRTDKGFGNLSHEMKDAITTFLGDDADQGELKAHINYFGERDSIEDERKKRKTPERVRHVVVPPLNGIKPFLARYGRG